MKQAKADQMIDVLRKIITYHNNWIQRQKDLKTAASMFDNEVQKLAKMINEEVKE